MTADDAVDLTPGPYVCDVCWRDFDSHVTFNDHIDTCVSDDGGDWFFGGAR